MKNNMRILLIYFTGTYNTMFLTTLTKNYYLTKNESVDVVSIFDNNKIGFEKYDIIGIGYPIHCYNAPKFLTDKLEKLPIKNKKYFIYKNGGEPVKFNQASSRKIIKIMNKNGNEFLNEFEFAMPSNIICKTDDGLIKKEVEYAIKYVKYMCDNLFVKQKYKITLISRIISFFSSFSFKYLKNNSKNYSIDTKNCIRCRKCIDNCPRKNIVYNREVKKIIFLDKCVNCMRCVYSCENNAISIGKIEKYKVNGSNDLLKIKNSNVKFDSSLLNRKELANFTKYFKDIDKKIN